MCWRDAHSRSYSYVTAQGVNKIRWKLITFHFDHISDFQAVQVTAHFAIWIGLNDEFKVSLLVGESDRGVRLGHGRISWGWVGWGVGSEGVREGVWGYVTICGVRW